MQAKRSLMELAQVGNDGLGHPQCSGALVITKPFRCGRPQRSTNVSVTFKLLKDISSRPSAPACLSLCYAPSQFRVKGDSEVAVGMELK